MEPLLFFLAPSRTSWKGAATCLWAGMFPESSFKGAPWFEPQLPHAKGPATTPLPPSSSTG